MSEVGTSRARTAAEEAVEDGTVPGQGPPPRRVAFLDVARALAMIGVVTMNVSMVVVPLELAQGLDHDLLTSVVDRALTVLMSGRSRTMLMVLLGAGTVLAWRAAVRRGGRPMAVMLRRYTVMGLLFGVAHLAVFVADILTHYAIAAVLLAPLMPLLLGGSRRRPLVAAVVAFAAAPLVQHLLNPLVGEFRWDPSLGVVPQTVGFFCVGVWLARRPELTAEPGAARAPRLPLRMLVAGVVLQALSMAPALVAAMAFPTEFDADGVPVRSVGESMLMLTGDTFLNLGSALFYLGLVWWLVLRDRGAARVLGTLAPLGRMSLTVYLGSTAVFLAVMGPFEGAVPLLAQYGLAIGYFAVMAVFARLWERRFRLGPLEWVWRSLTYLRPMPLRRPSAAQPPATEGSTRTSAPSRTGADSPPEPRHSSSSTNTLT